MDIFCTYCSALKDRAPGDLPVLQRYQSQRIRTVAATAETLVVGFAVLSGKFGLLQANNLIPWYDHLLQPNEVDSMSNLVSKQLTRLGTHRVLFWMRPIDQDPLLVPYLAVMQNACHLAGVELTVFNLGREELFD